MHLFSHLLTVKLIKLMNGHMNAEYIRGLCVNCVSFLNDCEKREDEVLKSSEIYGLIMSAT